MTGRGSNGETGRRGRRCRSTRGGRSGRGGRSVEADPSEPDATPPDPDVVDRLRNLRNQLAVAQSVPAYVIFNNKTLDAIARLRPTSETELAAVPGIGPNRLDAYGADILAAVRGA